jgi:hypothetical protein
MYGSDLSATIVREVCFRLAIALFYRLSMPPFFGGVLAVVI